MPALETEKTRLPDGGELRKPRILVAPLDWGLGHTTRCIPIIQELVLHGCEVMIAGNEEQEILLKKEFPSLSFLPLTGYNIRYANPGHNLLWKMMRQLPRLKKTIQYERQWLKEKVNEFNFDAVISDNRYGLYHKKIPSIFITHQLSIKSPWKWTEKIIQKNNYKYINRFNECWIPDQEENNNLSGELSHPEKKPSCTLKYIGNLSRFKRSGAAEIKDHLLIVLSGPEPQRSIFENLIISQISQYDGSATVVRGLPGSTSVVPSTNSIHFYNHLPSEKLNIEMEKAEFVIARSGYSTIMDAAALNKKCILVPTPGQTEQEYLAKYLSEKQMCLVILQKNFSFIKALNTAAEFSFRFPDAGSGKYLNKTIDYFLTTLSH